jgi:hypothetical protein
LGGIFAEKWPGLGQQQFVDQDSTPPIMIVYSCGPEIAMLMRHALEHDCCFFRVLFEPVSQ